MCFFTSKAVLVLSLGSALAHGDPQTKRGLALQPDSHDSDNNLITSDDSLVSWYYTWSAYPSPDIDENIVFLPLVHGVDDASSSEVKSMLGRLPASSTHLLTFNEPDGSTDSGGSSISPKDAAKSYLEDIVPLRDGSERSWNISHPVVTGSDNGLKWLRKFNESCYDLDDGGCPTDFIAVHYYGEFAGLVSWLDTIRDFYDTSNTELELWITEMALPQQDEEATRSMMEESLAYLDGEDDVRGYSWFGAFRSDDANEWTGDEVSLFDGKGRLTEIGAMYLGGEEKGFEEGMKGGSSRTFRSVSLGLASVFVLFCFVV